MTPAENDNHLFYVHGEKKLRNQPASAKQLWRRGKVIANKKALRNQ